MRKKSLLAIILAITISAISLLLMHYGIARVVVASDSFPVSEQESVKFSPQIILTEDFPPDRLYYNYTNELLYGLRTSGDSYYVLDKSSIINRGQYSF
jgi:hypothetical protein